MIQLPIADPRGTAITTPRSPRPAADHLQGGEPQRLRGPADDLVGTAGIARHTILPGGAEIDSVGERVTVRRGR